MRPSGFLALSLAGGLGGVFLQGPDCAEGRVPTAELLAQGLRLFHKARLPFHREGDTVKPDLSPCSQMSKVSKGSTRVCRHVHACEHVCGCVQKCAYFRVRVDVSTCLNMWYMHACGGVCASACPCGGCLLGPGMKGAMWDEEEGGRKGASWSGWACSLGGLCDPPPPAGPALRAVA